jgi:Uma2 family endonuclease
LISGEELARMGDLGRCELIDGRIVRMSPTNYEHGGVEVNLASLLRAFVRPRKLGRVLAGDVGIYTRRNPDRVRGADVAFITGESYSRRSRGLAFLDVAPELVVEVLSPEDRAMDVTQKHREYFAIGVRLVWLADPEAHVVSVYRSLSDVRERKEGDRLTGGDVLPGFEVPVAEIFEE